MLKSIFKEVNKKYSFKYLFSGFHYSQHNLNLNRFNISHAFSFRRLGGFLYLLFARCRHSIVTAFHRLRNLRASQIRLNAIRVLTVIILTTVVIGPSGLPILEAAQNNSTPPGGPMGDPTIDLSHGSVKSEFSLGGTVDGSSPGYNLRASYSSNVQDVAKAWVQDYQPGELGLG